MLTRGKNCSDGRYDPWESVRIHHQDSFMVQPLTEHSSEQGVPGFLALPVTLDETQVLPLSHLREAYYRQGGYPADPLFVHFEIRPINPEISEALGDRAVQPPDQLLFHALVHPAHFGRTYFSTPEQIRNFPHFAGRDRAKKHLRDELVDPLVLFAVVAQNGALRRSRPPASGHMQILDETKAGFELPWPRPIATVFLRRRSLATFGNDESEDPVVSVSLQHLSHELPDSHLNIVQELSDAFELACGFIKSTCTRA
jgi:hypothetical protein